MQWLGYLVGDGHVGRRGIRFKDPDIDTLTTYQQIAQQCFNIEGRIVPLSDANASLLEINSLGLAAWVRRNVLQRYTQFLDEVGALPDEHLAGFLRGLFDAEGCVARRAGQIALAMTDAELVRRIQLWLLRFGILASTCHEEAKPAQRRPRATLKLLITRHDALARFQEAIGFSSVRKRDWLQGVLAAKQEGHYLSSRAVSIRSDLQGCLDAPIRYQEILSVQRLPSTKTPVYDLEVEGTENFFANGILSHNSRWATHGEPTERNAHPHADCNGKLAVIHNGIIENYAELKDRLLEKGHTFRSKTDTEVIVHLVEEHAKSRPVAEAFRLALKELRGAYAVCLLSAQEPDRLFGARNSSPLIVGVGDGEAFLASDVPAILGHTRRVIYLNDDEAVELSAGGARLTTLDGKPVRRAPSTVSFSREAAQRGGFPHFMLKEIHEQPTALRQTLSNRLDASRGRVTFDRRTKAFLDALSPTEKLVIIACGTAYHAGLVGEYMLEELARLPVDVDLASEFRYRGPMLDRRTTVVAITQSGETADTLAGVRLAKVQGAKVLAICNVVGSSIAREADAILYTHAGPEIAVASTKAYTSQLAALSLITLYLAKRFKRVSSARWRALVEGLAALPDAVRRALAVEAEVKRTAAAYAAARNFYFLGRRSHYPSALEGALKLKEICPLIHAEGYAAGEMKHGPISLIRKGWPVVFLATDSPVYEKVVSNIEEIRARKGSCIVIATEGNAAIKRHADHVLHVPRTEELFSPVAAAIPLQLLAYHIAEANGCDIDQPPNLAKSVTVE
jgi:glucosamine--fructose-6-phosphate aminotransferase (isomerizing)